MIRYSLAGLILAAVVTMFIAGFILPKVGYAGPYAVLITAVGLRVAVLAVVVWLALSLIYRGPGRMSSFL